jgi:hypothetical protein
MKPYKQSIALYLPGTLWQSKIMFLKFHTQSSPDCSNTSRQRRTSFSAKLSFGGSKDSNNELGFTPASVS